MRKVAGEGPTKADIVIVGEAPGEDEERQGKPFVGSAGWELDKLLKESGIKREDCYVTNLCKYRPPNNKMEQWIINPKNKKKGSMGKKAALEAGYTLRDSMYAHPLVMEGCEEIRDEILLREPKVIIGLGNTPLWGLKGEWGIMDWRGSEMLWNDIPFVPTIHPAAIQRNYGVRPQVLLDLQYRVARRLKHGFHRKQFYFTIYPTLQDVRRFISNLSSWVSVDIETCNGHIVCLGLGDHKQYAMCIPFQNEHGAYWKPDEEKIVIELLRKKLENPKTYIIGQNYAYDAQYLERCFNIKSRPTWDTLIAESVLYPGNPRGLGYLSSLYCEWHCYWKDDAKDWSKIRDANAFRQLFEYNGRDVVAPIEIMEGQKKQLEMAGLMPQFADRMKYSQHVYDMMMRGVIRDKNRTKHLNEEVDEALQTLRMLVVNKTSVDVNPKSPVQVSKLLYNTLGIKKGANDSTNAEALKDLAEKVPEHAPVILAIADYRSLASIQATFLAAKIDPDGFLRSSWMATGTETFRLTSSKNAFERGCNLQNITGGTSHTGHKLPNLRRSIVPPIGFTIFDCDLTRADLYPVVWEANDHDLKAKLRAGADIHVENAKDLFGIREVDDKQRYFAKTFVHLTNYGGKERTCAIKCGCTVHEASQAQRRWFQAHPGIKRRIQTIQAMLNGTRTVKNPFGFRKVYFDRLDGVLNEALAWSPSSTVAIVISYIHEAFDSVPGVQIIMQGHDSLTGIYPTEMEDIILPQLYNAGKVWVPYADPVCIPLELKTSTESWGDCKKRSWPV